MDELSRGPAASSSRRSWAARDADQKGSLDRSLMFGAARPYEYLSVQDADVSCRVGTWQTHMIRQDTLIAVTRVGATHDGRRLTHHRSTSWRTVEHPMIFRDAVDYVRQRLIEVP